MFLIGGFWSHDIHTVSWLDTTQTDTFRIIQLKFLAAHIFLTSTFFQVYLVMIFEPKISNALLTEWC